MQTKIAKLFSSLAILLFFASIGLRLAMLLFDLDNIAVVFYYVVVVSGILAVSLESIDTKEYANAFIFKNNFHLNIFAYIASLGFFMDFVHLCIIAFSSIENAEYKQPVFFIPVCLSAFFALMSCFYFYTVGMSFGDKNYDFRELRILHLAPVGWAVSQILSVLQQSISFMTDMDSIIKYLALIFCVLFFYFFAAEIERDSAAKAATLICARALYFISALFLANRLMLFLSHNASVADDDSLLSVSVFLIATFVFFFEKNIISHKV